MKGKIEQTPTKRGRNRGDGTRDLVTPWSISRVHIRINKYFRTYNKETGGDL